MEYYKRMMVALSLLAAASEASDTTIDFKMIRPGVPLISVPVQVNGQGPFIFVLDTGNGAAPLILSRALSEKLGMKTIEHKDPEKAFMVGNDGAPSLRLGSVEEFKIGDLTSKRMKVAVSDAIDHLNERTKISADGNIGYGFLKDYAVGIDYRNSTLTFARHPRKGVGTPFVIGKKPLIVLEATVNGETFHFVLDTGAGSTVVSERLAEKLKLMYEAEVPMMGAAGLDKGHLATLDSFRIGEAEQKNLRVVAAGFVSKLGEVIGRPIDGIVGFNFLREYQVTIDYPNLTLGLEGH